MKATFKSSWKSSVQPRKQRKFRANAPLHVVSRLLHATLSKDLRKKHNKRSLRVRRGDEVEVLRGDHAGKRGVVDEVHTTKKRLIIRGVELPKHDGSKRAYPVAVSNVRIIKLTEDKRRL